MPVEGVQKSDAENHLLAGSNFVPDSPLPSFRPNEMFWSHLLILVGGEGGGGRRVHLVQKDVV